MGNSIKPTKIGKTGNVRGSLTSSSGGQKSFLPGRDSYSNGGIKRGKVTGSTPATSSPGFIQPAAKGNANPGTGGKK